MVSSYSDGPEVHGQSIHGERSLEKSVLKSSFVLSLQLHKFFHMCGKHKEFH